MSSKKWYFDAVTHNLVYECIDLPTISEGWVKVPDGTELIISLHDIIEFRKGRYHRFIDSNEWCGGQSTSVSQIREGILDCEILHDFGDLDKSVGEVEIESTESTNDNGTLKPIKSDGGSSSYYFTKLPQHMIDEIVKTGGIEIKDIVRYCFDNDADCKDIIKALKRIRENLKGGGKEGCDSLYNAKKVLYFAEELLKVVDRDRL